MTKRISDQTPEERRLEAELARERRDEADANDRPALARMVQRIAEEDAQSVPPERRRIRDQTPEERRLEGELLRDQRDEADANDRPALARMVQRIEREDAEAEEEEKNGHAETDEGRTD